MRNIESRIQKSCVMWFRLAYPDVEGLFFAVPNGGRRDAWTARIMKDEGVRAGVADLILLLPRGGYGALAVEMKTPKGKQSAEQKRFQMLCERHGICYVVCRCFDDFRNAVKRYMEGG